MEKSKMIIADYDEAYAAPIVANIVENYYEKVDIELITDKETFDKAFSEIKKADILIISQELYSDSLSLQGFEHVFVLCENLPKINADNNIYFINKYTSLKEFFFELLSRCAHIFGAQTDYFVKPRLVVVSSGCGGTGKTTIALSISSYIASMGKRVLYIDAEDLQTFQHHLCNNSPVTENIYMKCTNAGPGIYGELRYVLRNEGFTYLPPFKGSLISQGISKSIYSMIAKEAVESGEYDFVIVDTDSSFDLEKTDLLGLADKVILVTKQNRSSIYNTNVLIKNIGGVTPDRFLYICNDFKNKDGLNVLNEDTMEFVIDEYIEHVEDGDELTISEYAKMKSIQKVGFLLI